MLKHVFVFYGGPATGKTCLLNLLDKNKTYIKDEFIPTPGNLGKLRDMLKNDREYDKIVLVTNTLARFTPGFVEVLKESTNCLVTFCDFTKLSRC